MSNGITYFPLDVHMDDNIELIEAEFGLTGFAVIVKLYQKIYGDLGYYCEWTNDVALLFTRRVGCSAVSEIVAAAIRRGIFDEGLFHKYQILTSRGIQKRYLDVVSRRKEVTVKKEYLLVEVAKKYNNVNIIEENVNISNENVCISKQRKEKESKVKESKEKKNIYGEFGNVALTEEEYVKLQTAYPDYQERIERLSAYIASTGKRYKSHYATILNWARKDGGNRTAKPKETSFMDIDVEGLL